MKGLSIDREPDTVTIVYNASEAKTEKFPGFFFIIFYIIWLPATLAVTWALILNPYNLFFYVWLIFGYAGVFLVPVAFANYWSLEEYTITKLGINIIQNQFFYKKRLFLKSKNIVRFSYGEDTVDGSTNTIILYYKHRFSR